MDIQQSTFGHSWQKVECNIPVQKSGIRKEFWKNGILTRGATKGFVRPAEWLLVA